MTSNTERIANAERLRAAGDYRGARTLYVIAMMQATDPAAAWELWLQAREMNRLLEDFQRLDAINQQQIEQLGRPSAIDRPVDTAR